MIHLKAPKLTEDLIVDYVVGSRPYRPLGMRIEQEELYKKRIIHNYGHGGAGITLSFGSAKFACRFIKDLPLDTPITIIGAGVIGLTTAILLGDLGYTKIRIITSEITPNTTSDIAAGLWHPFKVESGLGTPAKEKFERITKQSKEYFHSLAISTEPRFAGVHLVKGYSLTNIQSENTVQVEFDNAKSMWAVAEETLMIDTKLYLDSLMKELEKREVQIIRAKLVYSDIQILSENVIFNCSGLGTRELFNDTNLVAVKGHLIVFKAQKGIDYFAAFEPTSEDQTYFTCLFPHKQQFLIGGNMEENEWSNDIDTEACRRIIDDARKMFNL